MNYTDFSMIYSIRSQFTWDNLYHFLARFTAGLLIILVIGLTIFGIGGFIAQGLKDSRVWLWLLFFLVSYLTGHIVYRNYNWDEDDVIDDPWEKRIVSPPPDRD